MNRVHDIVPLQIEQHVIQDFRIVDLTIDSVIGFCILRFLGKGSRDHNRSAILPCDRVIVCKFTLIIQFAAVVFLSVCLQL